MRKKIELFFAAILVPLDFLTLMLAAIVAYAIRFTEFATEVRPATEIITYREYLLLSASFGVLWVFLFAVAGLYTMRGTRRIVDEVTKVILACSTGVLIVILTIFFQRELFASRFIIITVWLLAILFIIIERSLVLWVERFLFTKGVGVYHIVVIGHDETTERLVAAFHRYPRLGHKIVGRIRQWNGTSVEKLKKMHETIGLDIVFQADPDATRNALMPLIDFCEEHHIAFKYIADLFATHATNISMTTIGGIPIVEIKQTRLDGWGKIWKRTFDIAGSFFLILLFSPLMALIACAIKLDSRGPVLFRTLTDEPDGPPLERVGQYGKAFRYFKFRTMQPGMHHLRYSTLAEKNLRKGSPLVKIQNDPRITRVGAWLRRFSLDELPEFFLVLRGEMSLVGPRPHLPEEVAQYARHHKKVLTLKPGITGLAQISGRSDLSFEDEVRLDSFYIEHWSPWLDLYILLRTPFAVLAKRKAE